MEVAKTSLEIKRKVLEKFTENSLYPYTKFYLRAIRERFGQYWKNHFSTIGLIGMNEACCNLLGADIASEKGQLFSLRVLEFMRERLVAFQEETGNNYNLEATPAEGTSYRLARLDAEQFPGIQSANIEGGKPFYTNSSQLPVHYSDDPFEVLDLQDELQTRYTGGTVVHLFVGEEITNPASVAELVKVICSRYRLPYFTITPTFSICPNHGYLPGKQESCPTLRRGLRGLLARGRVPAPGEPVERGQGGGVQAAEDVQDRAGGGGGEGTPGRSERGTADPLSRPVIPAAVRLPALRLLPRHPGRPRHRVTIDSGPFRDRSAHRPITFLRRA